MNAESRERELIRQVVRGERDWNDLREIGVVIEISPNVDGRHQVTENLHGICVFVELDDVLQGFRRHLSDPEALRRWVFAMMGTVVWDFDPALDDDPAYDVVREALWDVRYAEPLSDEMLVLLRS